MTDAARIHKTMTRRDWGLLLFLSVLWGGSFFFNQVALAELPPLTLVLLRVALAAGILRAVMRLKGIAMPRDPSIWRAFLAMGLLNNAVPFSLIVWGQSHIASGVAAIMNASTPLFTVLLAHWLTRDERLTAGRLVGVGLGLAGVAVMMGGAVPGGTGATLAGQAACLAAAGATNLLLVTLLIPVTAILLGVAVLGETLLPRHLAGMALIGLGLAAIDGRPPTAAIRLARRGLRDSLRAPPHRVEGERTP